MERLKEQKEKRMVCEANIFLLFWIINVADFKHLNLMPIKKFQLWRAQNINYIYGISFMVLYKYALTRPPSSLQI